MASAAPLPIISTKAQREARLIRQALEELEQEERANNGEAMGSASSSPSQTQGEAFDSVTGELLGHSTTESPRGQPLPFPTGELTEVGKRLLADARRKKAKSEKDANPLHQRRGLSPDIKSRMIELFAQFQGVTQVADAIKREFGQTLDRRTVESFNPDSPRARVGKRLRLMFETHRKAYVDATAKQGVAHQAHRLRLIGELVEKASNSKDFAAALRGLELAAKEMGGLSQTVRHEGTVSHAHIHASIEDAKAELAMRLASFVDSGQAPTLLAAPTEESTPTAPPTEGG